MLKNVIKVLRIIFIFASVIFGMWFFIPMLKGIICIGNIFGVFMCIFVFAHCVFNNKFKVMKEKFFEKKFLHFLWRFCQVCITIFVIYAVAATCSMIYFSTLAPVKDSTVITLGAKVRYNKVPSSSLRERIEACYNYLSANPGSKAVLSGGKGKNEPISEAQCMYDNLVEMGIDKERLIIEDKSTNTESNIKNSYKLIEENNLSKDIAIATDGYHQLRARIIAKKQGVDGHIGAVNSDSPLSVLPTYYVREWFALPVEIIK